MAANLTSNTTHEVNKTENQTKSKSTEEAGLTKETVKDFKKQMDDMVGMYKET